MLSLALAIHLKGYFQTSSMLLGPLNFGNVAVLQPRLYMKSWELTLVVT